jgi:cellulose synthase/poly-beta-1,6-N-acetylglucosamine synthase-like glycosyltransferase
MTVFVEIAFWFSALTLFYVYLGYPLLVRALSHRTPPKPPDGPFLPSVSLIVSAYNEERVIAAKLDNSLLLDYPRDLLEIIVVSDCSDDGTDEIVRQFPVSGITLVRQHQRLGKSAGLNLGVSHTSGQLLVFSDANALYRHDSLRKLVRHFTNPRVGYVVGNSRYVEDSVSSQSAQSEGLYWKFETWLKKCESSFHSVVGGDGAIYAIRRTLFFPLRATDINDFLNPLQIINRGYIGVFEPDAISYERAAQTFNQEFRRKTRIVSRSLHAVTQVPGVLNPFNDPRHWFMLISHKVLRWFAPCFMVLLLALSLALWNVTPYRLAALTQILFYSLALVGRFTRTNLKTFYLPYYFCLINSASLVGIFQYLTGDLSSTWSPVRLETDGVLGGDR